MKKNYLFILLNLFVTSSLFAQSQPITLDLSNPTVPTSFTLNDKNVWTETFNDVDYPYIEFNNSIFDFTHLGAGEGNGWWGYYWDGFTYSKNGDNTDQLAPGGGGWGNNQWGNMAAGGIKTDAAGNVLTDENGVALTDINVPYLVAYWGFEEYTYPSLSVFFDDVYQAEGVYVNNSPWTYYANLNGDGYARPLNQNGDYLKLIIHGFDENHNDNGKKVEYYLAKFENGTLTQSPNWEWIDLSGLGEVAGIYFTMESTDNDPVYGMKTAAYFCMDRLQVHVPGTTTFVAVTDIINLPETAIIGIPLMLTGTIIPDDATYQTIIWSVESVGTTGATITGNLFKATGEGVAMVSATIENGMAEGKDYTKEFNISVIRGNAIGEHALSNIRIYSYSNTIYIKNEENVALKSVEIFDMMGRLVYKGDIHARETTISHSFADGIYAVRLILKNNRTLAIKVLLN
jgi:hypothetical protein